MLSGTNIDLDLSFEEHINNKSKKKSQKLHVLARIAGYIDITKKRRRIVMKSVTMPQFGDCSLVWMFHRRSLNNNINSLHNMALGITYNDQTSYFYSY